MIFGKDNSYDYGINMEAFEDIEPQSDNFFEESMKIAYESTVNHNTMLQALGIEETTYYYDTGEEPIYESVGEFFSKVKEFFVKLWQKIKGLFTKFFALINSFVKSDKDFINKYRKQLSTVDTSKMKYKGYEFTIDTVNIQTAKNNMLKKINDNFSVGTTTEPADYNAFASEVKKYLDSHPGDGLKDLSSKFMEQDTDNLYDSLRGTAIGDTSSYTVSEFSKELFAKLRNKESLKQEFDGINLSEYITYLDGSAKQVKNAKDAYNDNKKIFESLIRWADKMTNDIRTAASKKSKDDISDDNFKQYANGPENKIGAYTINIINKYNSAIKTASNILATINGAILTAYKDKSRQAKGICVKALTFKPKNESFDYDYEENSGGLLENVKMI